MALLLRNPRILCSTIPKSFVKTLHKSTTDGVATDTIAEFTDDLMLKKQLRWEILLQEKKKTSGRGDSSSLKEVTAFINLIKRTTERSLSQVSFVSVDFEKLDEKHIDHLVLSACLDKNTEFVDKFVDQCVDGNKVVGENTMLTVCEYFSTHRNNRNSLIKLIDLCKVNNRLVYDQNCEFKHFKARHFWEKGNSDEALTLLGEALEQVRGFNTPVLTSVLSTYRFIVKDTVDNKSEAILVRLIRAATLLQTRLNESSILIYLWKVCFQSTWFSNQVVADQLFSDHSEIRIDAAQRRGFMTYNALCIGEVDMVHRLIHAFLKFEMRQECKLVLELLFEYQYAHKNLQACSEILKTTLELDIYLDDTYSQKLIHLLTGGKFTNTKPKKDVTPKFTFKF
ncbi:uncharacterized protein LOC119073357 [Bradysia coprophila]|uniref:uncharacterized protein LOC119073357 n=1 Tax=Bradysia coprophila TaxID=38358 RepID=UPI00187D908A|nr:uncharacterized protein LOC119073357 [Bradysia coprophila]